MNTVNIHIPHTYMCKSFSAVSVLGDFDIINVIDVTAESDRDNTALFQFEFDPVTHLNTSLGYALRLTWSQVSGPASGVIQVANWKRYQSNVQLERVRRTGTYRLYVPLHFFGEGRLLVNISINISCSKYQYIGRYWYQISWYYWYDCKDDWQIRGSSDPLEISAKRGWYVCTHLYILYNTSKPHLPETEHERVRK